MNNPLIKAMGKNNPINKMLSFMNGGGNPAQLAEQILSKNPRAGEIIQMMKNECGDRSPKEYAIELCKKQGGDPEQLLALAKRFGLS